MRAAGVVTFDVTVEPINDGGLVWACVFDDLPEFVGHGATEDEAMTDLREQLNLIVWH
jgi:predicted RNase H-like HicB family nuclease